MLLSAEPISHYGAFPVLLFIFLEFITALFYLLGFFSNQYFIPNASQEMESPSEKYFTLGQMYQVIYQFCFCFHLETPGVDLPPFLVWAGFSLGLLHDCHLETSLHCHPRICLCFSSVWFPVSRIPYILLSWFMPTWYFVLEILDWKSFPSESTVWVPVLLFINLVPFQFPIFLHMIWVPHPPQDLRYSHFS